MIRAFPEALRPLSAPDHRWLVLGKGPSFARYAELGAGGRRVCALNHVAAEVDCDIAHVADLDVIEDCGEAIAERARYLVMPWRPHVVFGPSQTALDDLADTFPPLRRMAAEGRLLCYNLSTGHGLPMHPTAPWIPTDTFGGPVAARVLAEAGAREIRTLGVDGGQRYASAFGRLSASTLLNNGASSFDLQFKSFAALGRERGLVWGPLYAPMPIRVEIPATPDCRLAAALLAVMLEDCASGAVMAQLCDEEDDAIEAAARGAAAANFEGRVLRLTPTVMPVGDPLPLWCSDMDDAAALADASGAAMLIDAAHPAWRNRAAGPLRPGPLPAGSIATPADAARHSAALVDLHTAPRPWESGGGATEAGQIWRRQLQQALAFYRLSPDVLCTALQTGTASPELVLPYDPQLLDPDLMQSPAAWRVRFRQAQRARRKLDVLPGGHWRSLPGRALRRAASVLDTALSSKQGREPDQASCPDAQERALRRP
jgi:hypothetical protein